MFFRHVTPLMHFHSVVPFLKKYHDFFHVFKYLREIAIQKALLEQRLKAVRRVDFFHFLPRIH